MPVFCGIFLVLCAASLLASGVIVSSWLYLFPLSPLSFAVVTLGALAVIAPRAAIALALVAVPFGGNRPGTTHAEVAIVLGASLLLGLSLRRWRIERQTFTQLWKEVSATPLLLAAFLYLLFSCGSLISLPLPYLINDLRNAVDRSSLHHIAFSIRALLTTNEHALVYSVVSVYLTSLSFLLSLFAWQLCDADKGRTGRLFFGAVLIGLVSTFLLGLLDYYSFINISGFRELDPIVNPKNRQFRLQSVFAHSGWYAEFITLTIPTCLVILSLKLPFWVRASILLALLALGEFVLILTYQRGGWLSYPLTLVAVWGAIYVVRRLEQQNTDVLAALKRSAAKVLISLPITIAISLLLVFAFQKGDSAEDALSPYVSRFKDIQRTGDRTDFLFAGTLIGMKHPIMGGGSDSFAWQFEREFESETGSFFKRYTLPLHGSAHNVYAQTFSGKGLCGLLALLALPFLILKGAKRAITSPASSLDSKLLVLTGACFACAFLIYGNVQEVFYIQTLQFLFFIMVGVVAAELPQKAPQPSRWGLTSPALFILLLSAHFAWEFLWPGETRAWSRQERPFGCFPVEKLPSGGSYQWCSERAIVAIPAGQAALTLEAGPLNQTITIAINPPTASESVVELAAGERKQVQITPNSSGKTFVRLTATTSFVPAIKWPESADQRRLAFKIVAR